MSNSAVIKLCIGVGQDNFPFISVLPGGEGLMEKGASPACVCVSAYFNGGRLVVRSDGIV